jgi:hypothetical protein
MDSRVKSGTTWTGDDASLVFEKAQASHCEGPVREEGAREPQKGAGDGITDGGSRGDGGSVTWTTKLVESAETEAGPSLRLADLYAENGPIRLSAATAQLLSADPLARRYAMQTLLANALPPGMPADEVKHLKEQLDELLAQAGSAKPMRLEGGRIVSPEEGLRSLADLLAHAATAYRLAGDRHVDAPVGQWSESKRSEAGWQPAPVHPSEANRTSPSQPSRSESTAPKSGDTGKSHELDTKKASESYGPPAAEKEAIRKRIDAAMKANSDDQFKALAQDKDALALMTPSEKAGMIRRLMKGWTTDSEDRAMLNVLESCKTREEFDQVMRESGGGKVLGEMDDSTTKHKTAMLFQMWGRTDLIPANLKKYAAQAEEGCLMRADTGLDGIGSNPAEVDADDNTNQGGAEGTEKRSFYKHLYNEMPPGTRAELMMENSLRKSSGKPPLDYAKLQADLRAIMSDDSLDKKAKDAKVEELRKSYGLSGDTMRELGSGRQAEVTSRVQKDVQSMYVAELQSLAAKRDALVEQEGEDGPDVVALDRKMKEISAEAEKRLGRLQAQHDELGELYKIPPSFWEKAAAIVEKIAKAALPLVLSLLPGGAILMAGYAAVQGIAAAARGDIAGFLTGLAGAFGPFGEAIGGVASMVKTGVDLVKDGISVYKGVKAAAEGHWAEAVGDIAGGIGGAAKTFGVDAGALDTFNQGAKAAHAVTATVEGIAKGDWEEALGGLTEGYDQLPGGVKQRVGSFINDNPITRGVLEHTQQGVQFFHELRTGDYGAALGTLGNEASRLAEGTAAQAVVERLKKLPEEARARVNEFVDAHPEVQMVLAHGKRGLDIVEQLKRGDYAGALAAADAELGGAGRRTVERVLGDAAEKLNGPALKQLWETAAHSAPFVQSVLSGQYGRALELLYNGDEAKELRDKVGVARDAVKVFEPAFQAFAQGLTGLEGQVQQVTKVARPRLPGEGLVFIPG